jgi:hypothetical protein
MRLLDVAADRLVSLLAPKTTAGACACDPAPYTQVCSGCHERTKYTRNCSYDCNCKVYCSPCQPHAC